MEKDDDIRRKFFGTSFDELIEMAKNIDPNRREEASAYLDSLLKEKK